MLIVFDLDGTLSDSSAAIVATFQEACSLLGQPEPRPGPIEARIGLPLVRMFRELAPGGDPHALTEAYKAAYIPHDNRLTRVYPGIPELLDQLDATLAIATSKTTLGAERSVTRAGLRHHFDVVLGFDAVANPKPAPDMLLEAMRRTGSSPGRTLMVGDTTFDLEMADAAGVRGVGVAWGSHGREGLDRWPVAEDPSELAGLLAAAAR